MAVVLGISASLRNARYGLGNEQLISDLAELDSEEALTAYLRLQTQIRFQDFAEAGRAEKLPFDQIYKRLRKLRGERGLSNSEALVAAALWGAKCEGAEIRHLSLAHHFPMAGRGHQLEILRSQLMEADAIIISGPVYFGDRGSLTQSLIEFIAGDAELQKACVGKVYGGLAVGAKRNGGQETTLIYQLLDMLNLDFLAVGNSSETTSQYGGTGVAGDVGTMHKDAEGIETSYGTGQRVARVAEMLNKGRSAGAALRDSLKLQLWLLQDDKKGTGLALFQQWASELENAIDGVEVRILNAAESEVVRCIACDVCPTDVGPREEYRCIIKAKEDFFARNHTVLAEADAVLLCAYSTSNRSSLVSKYQQFIERTRYLRRDNYVFSDLMFAPFVISELEARQNLHLRMITSSVRHHTVLHHPLIGMMNNGEMLNRATLMARSVDFVKNARALTVGRYLANFREDVVYRPKGYEISAQKAAEDNASGKTGQLLHESAARHSTLAKRRIGAR